jgi:phosphohistidine phosphatase
VSPSGAGPHRLVVLRHAPAEHRDPRRWRNDDKRPLRSDGRKEFREAARALGHLLSTRGHVAVSPLTRALETAEILGEAWAPARRPVLWEELRPTASALKLLERVAATSGPRGDYVVVGHEPQLSRLVGLATTGEALPVVQFSKGGAVALDFPARLVPGGARIGWALTRSQLRRIRPDRRSRRAES